MGRQKVTTYQIGLACYIGWGRFTPYQIGMTWYNKLSLNAKKTKGQRRDLSRYSIQHRTVTNSQPNYWACTLMKI